MTTLSDLMKLAEAATPGPWKYVQRDGRQNQAVCALEEVIQEYHPTRKICTVVVTAWKPDGHRTAVHNAAFIAAHDPQVCAALVRVAMAAEKSELASMACQRELAALTQALGAQP